MGGPRRRRDASTAAHGALAAHVPVLCDAVVDSLARGPGGWVVDGTVGYGGHAEAILERLPHVRCLGLDLDPEALQAAALRLARFGARARLPQANFAGMD